MAWLGFFLFRRIDWAHVPHLLRNIYIAFVFGFSVGKILILLLMLIDEVRRLVLWIANLFYTGGTSVETDNTQSGITRSTFISRMALLVGGFALGGFLYGITNRYKYQVKRIRLSLKSLPDAFKGLKIVQISDIHSGSFDNHEAVKKGIQIVLDERPDIIFFTGDLVNNRADEVDTYKEIFSQLKAPMGVYSTLGNHDYGDYVDWPSAEAKHENLERLKALHGEMGWRLLMNEHIVFDRGDQSIAVIGIENWGNKANFPKYGDMKKATEGLAAKNVPVKILLSHDPSHWDAQVRPEYGDIQLTLSGHTHGMQFGVEIPWLKWSPIKYMYKEWAGLYQEGEQYLYVNRGFGFLGYPGRLGILPEITVIELA
jgi:predicted MPP superfamily phosphohydrolase